MKRVGGPKITLGYPTQIAAIEALYKNDTDARVIQAMTGATLNVVHRVISQYRKANQLPKLIYDYSSRIEPPHRGQHHPVWNGTDDEKRRAFHARAVKGAGEARRAANAHLD